MPRSAIRRNNVLAGLFLLAGLAIAVAVSFILSDFGSLLGGNRAYEVRFELADGVPGLEVGATVKVGGLAAGTVESIRYDWVKADGRTVPAAIIARIRVDKRVNFYQDAVASLEVPILGSGSTINIPSVGGRTTGIGWLDTGGEMQGRISPPGILAQAGFGDQERTRLQQVIADASETADRVRRWSEDADPRIEPALTQVEGAVDDFAGFASWLNEGTERWDGRITTILDDVARASGEIEPSITALRDDAQATIDDARRVLSSAQETIDENRPSIARIIENTESVTERVRTESMDDVASLIRQTQDGVDEFRSLGRRSNLFLVEQTPNVERALANFRLISDQVKLTVGEVRSQPWRLLFQPKTKELEQQLLLDSARAYALAASDLREASVSLDELLKTLPMSEQTDPDEVLRMRNRLRETFSAYQDAERALIEQFTNLE